MRSLDLLYDNFDRLGPLPCAGFQGVDSGGEFLGGDGLQRLGIHNTVLVHGLSLDRADGNFYGVYALDCLRKLTKQGVALAQYRRVNPKMLIDQTGGRKPKRGGGGK